MRTRDLPEILVPGDMDPGRMPDLLRYWYLGSKARRHMMLRRFAEVDTEVRGDGFGHVLDVGSAWGYNVMVLTKLGKKAVATDLVADQFPAGARIAAANRIDFAALGADASDLPFPGEVFDAVTMVETFEHIFDADRENALAECRRVLRRGGRLVLSTPNYGSVIETLKRIIVRVPWLQHRLPTMCYPAENAGRSEYHPYRYHWPCPAGKLHDMLAGQGLRVSKTKYFLFVFKNAPDGAYPFLAAAERVLERIPLLNRLAATICVVAEKP